MSETGIQKAVGRIFVDQLTGKRTAVLNRSASELSDMTLIYASPVQRSDVWDAERYRWLRNESWAGYNNSKRKPQVFEIVTMILGGARNFETILAEEALDEAIDAAIAADTSKPIKKCG